MIQIRGADELIAKLIRLERMDAVKAVLKAAALYLKGRLAKYPTQAHLTRAWVYGQTFFSQAQQRFFFWAMREGIISVPYRRGQDASSERFGASWAIAQTDGGMTQIVGNDTGYGHFMMGDDQTMFAQASGWLKADDIAEIEKYQVTNMVQAGLEKELNS